MTECQGPTRGKPGASSGRAVAEEMRGNEEASWDDSYLRGVKLSDLQEHSPLEMLSPRKRIRAVNTSAFPLSIPPFFCGPFPFTKPNQKPQEMGSC